MSATPCKQPQCSSVYGPVQSWRFGRSLGIDPIGAVSTCSFNCVYCQLGQIQAHTAKRLIFVPTAQIIQDLRAIAPWEYMDVVTLSGSGEPTLALNLEEILSVVKKVLQKPTVVLTNSTLLGDPSVRNALKLADIVAAKLDAVSSNPMQQINRPVATIDLPDILAGIAQLRREYQGYLAIQTMVLYPWTPNMLKDYIQKLRYLNPDEVQLNTPSRPRVMARDLDARGNDMEVSQSENLLNLKCVHTQILASLATQIQDATKIPVRYANS